MQPFLCALTFLTRIPIPVKCNYTPENFARSLYFFPVIGLILGGILGGSWLGLKHLFPPIITGALILLIHILLTGGLHLDGLMDTLDGLGGGKNKEQRLAIMKDSRVGAFGVQGAILNCILKFSVYTQLTMPLLPLLIITPMIGRQALVLVQVFFPYARSQGLGSLFTVYGDYKKFAITTAITLLITIVSLKITGAILLLLSYIFVLVIGALISRLLDGLTGDTYGATCELTELFLLMVGFLLLR